MAGIRNNHLFFMTVRVGMILALLAGAFPNLSATPVQAAYSISLTSSSAYTQNFDMLSATLGSTTNMLVLDGWYLTENGGGARDNEQYAVDSGASTTGDTYSYGASGSTNRALGSLRSGTLLPVFGASFTNDTDFTISSVDISYTGEQWRLGAQGRQDKLTFQYSLNATSLTTGTWTDVSALDFTSPVTSGVAGALNGDAPANQASISASITGLAISTGNSFWVRWLDFDALAADDGLAVDDFSLTPRSCQNLITVTNNTDSGAGSLRQAIVDICPGGTITFSGDFHISISSMLTIPRNMTIDAAGQSVILQTGQMEISSGGTALVLSGLTLDGGNAGVRAFSNAGSLTLNQCILRNYSNSEPLLDGGAIFNSGTLSINHSTLSSNTAQAYGGAIYNNGLLTINQSTLSGNHASRGGGIYNNQTLHLKNSTLSENNASLAGGGIDNHGNADLTNALMANSSPTDCDDEGVVSTTQSLIESGSCESDLTGDPLLAPLGDYGGAALTYALLPGSPAIDAGDPATCPDTDQRGVTTPQGSACDIGAFESQGFSLDIGGGNDQTALINTGFSHPLEVSVTANQPVEPVNGGKVTFTAPDSGASAVLTAGPATISGGTASVSATANGTAGAYMVSASATGAAASADFSLDNIEAVSITVNQAPTQADPANTAPIRFIAVFNPAINPATFTPEDIRLGGSAPGDRVATLTQIAPNDGTTFEILVSGMSGSGTITAALDAGKVKDLNGNDNLASSSTDHSVTYAHSVSTTIVLSAVEHPHPIGQAWTLTATVASGAGVPTGIVIFKDGATVLGTVSLTNGIAALDIPTFTVGVHTVAAEFQGSGGFAGSVSAEVVIHANQYLILPLIFR